MNTYLHRIGKANTRNCQQCNNIPGEAPTPETVAHYIFDCTAYDNERRELERAVGNRNYTLQSLMAEEKGMKSLARYVSQTG